ILSRGMRHDARPDERVAAIPSADTDAAVPAGIDRDRTAGAERRLADFAVAGVVRVVTGIRAPVGIRLAEPAVATLREGARCHTDHEKEREGFSRAITEHRETSEAFDGAEARSVYRIRSAGLQACCSPKGLRYLSWRLCFR